MADHFGRAGRRADLARLLHASLVEHGMTALQGSARATSDAKVAQVAADLGISENVALRNLDDQLVVELADWARYAASIANPATTDPDE